MAWHIVEKLLEESAQHSTLIGKFWTTFFFVLRFLIVVSIADNIYEDEQEEFTCNTLTPGCENVCFNEFSPLSQLRLWALQVLAVSVPSMMFIVYTAHKTAKIEQSKKVMKEEKRKAVKKAKKKKKECRNKSWQLAGMKPPEYNYVDDVNDHVTGIVPVEPPEETKDDDDEEGEKGENEIIASKLEDDTPPRLLLAYVAQVVFRLFIEIAFIVVQMHIYVYKFNIPELFKCSRWPCPNVVDCFVSRPKEKTVMIWVMFGTAVIMIALGVIELYHIGIRKMFDAYNRRGEDITKQYKVGSNSMPHFGRSHDGYRRYRGGYPQAVGIRVGYARSSISGDDGGGIHGDDFI